MAWISEAEPGELAAKVEHPAVLAMDRAIAGRLRPASAPEFAVAIDRLVGFCRSFGLDGDPAEHVAFWREAVRHLPASAIAAGVSDLCRTWKYRRIPLPADLAAACEPHVLEWRKAQNRLWHARRRAQWRQPDPTPEERADPAKVRAFLESFEKAFATERDERTAA